MSHADPVAQTYDRLAPAYDRRWRAYEDATLAAAIDVLACGSGERLLDVACGTGELERRLLARETRL